MASGIVLHQQVSPFIKRRDERVTGNAAKEEIMRSEHQSQSQIPYRHDVPFEIRHAAIEQRLSAELSEVKRLGEDARKIKLILQEHRDSVINLLGCDKYEKFRAYARDQKRFRAKFFFPPRGPEMSEEEVKRFQLERREESENFLRELGVNGPQLRSLSRRTAARVREFGPSHPVREGKRAMVLLPSEVPSEIRSHKTNPWTIVGPPYGNYWWYIGYLGGFTFFPTLNLDPDIGLVGNTINIQDYDASDSDYGYVMHATNLYFWYQMPTAGLVEVWIEAEPQGSHHRLYLFNELGWSDSNVNQHNYLTLNASVGGSSSDLQLSETSWFSEDGKIAGYWDNRYFTDGGTYWANLKSDRRVIFPSGAWVLVEVGTLNWNTALADDVAVDSTVEASWIIKHVSIHSTGG